MLRNRVIFGVFFAALSCSLVATQVYAGSSVVSPLRVMAQQRDFYIGSEVIDSELFYSDPVVTNPSNQSVMAREFNLLSPGLEIGFANEPTPPTFNSAGNLVPNPVNPELDFDFTQADAMLTFAQANGMKVRAHTLLYYLSEPAWLTGCAAGQAISTCVTPYTSAQLAQILNYYIKTIVTHFKTKFPGVVIAWEVDNEHDYGYIAGRSYLSWRHSAWENILDPATGKTSVTYYDKLAFQAAQAADPSALLCYNENSIEDRDSLRGRDMYNFVKGLIAAGVPISCVGFQMHKLLSSYQGSTSMPTKADLMEQMKRYADLGLKLFVTEADVSIPTVSQGSFTQTAADTLSYRAAQAQVFSDGLSACLESSNCLGYITWGFNPRVSWLEGAALYGLPKGYSGDGQPFDANNAPKPAYTAMQTAMSTVINASDIVMASSMTPSSSGAGHVVKVSGPQDGNYELLLPKGTVSFTTKIATAGLYDIHLEASALTTKVGGPALSVAVDGTAITSWKLISTNNQDYLIQVPLTAQSHVITYTLLELGTSTVGSAVYLDRAWLQPTAPFTQYLTGNSLWATSSYVTVDNTANAQLKINSNTTANVSFTIPTTDYYQIDLAASGVVSGSVGPAVKLMVDGVVEGTFSVTNATNSSNVTNAQNYVASMLLTAGTHDIGVQLANASGVARALTIDHMEVFEQADGVVHLLSDGMLPPASSVGEVLTGNGFFQQSVNVSTPGSYKINIVAASRQVTDSTDLDDWATASVYVDNDLAGTFTVSGDGWTTYGPSVTISKSGTHSVLVKLTNWGSAASGGGYINVRNLAFHSVDLTPQ
jgi:endo-1,4-beta-xylanase